MKCHYEVLDIPRDANADEIKKAHRRLAMKWHPDKNLDNTEEATEQFKLIQQAFEVLSDPHERAWYDDHRESILKGKVGVACDDDSLDVYQYFTASCYQGFDDGEKGFYSVYREVFNKIAAEDSEYQTGEDSDFEVPSFGRSDSAHEEVNCFYNYWQSYCTKKSYSWMDTYDTREAPNRRISRAMEKENKKMRDKAKKARNEEVRELVKFVRKRDKRVQAYAQYLQELSAEKARKSEQKRVEKLKERKLQLASHKESEWSKFSNFENELKDIEANLASEFGDTISSENSDCEEEEVDNNLYCVACNKLFKTSKAFENHESSKKHKENVQILKVEMQDSDDSLDLESDETGEEEDTASDENDAISDNSNECIEEDFAQDGNNEDLENNDTNCNSNILDGDIVNDEPLFCKACGRWFKTEKAVSDHKLSQNHIKNVELYQEILKNLGSETEDDDDEDFEFNSDLDSTCEKEFIEDFVNGDASIREDLERLMSKFDALDENNESSLHDDVEKICTEMDKILEENEEKNKCNKNSSKQLEESSSDDSDFSLGLSKKKKRKQKSKQQVSSKNNEKTLKNGKKNQSKSSHSIPSTDLKKEDVKITEMSSTSQDSINLACDDSTIQSGSETEDLIKKSKQSTLSNKSIKKKQDSGKSKSDSQNLCDTTTSCAVCKSTFPSKNKLFQHLKKTGHSVYIPEKSSKSEDTNRDSGKKGKNKKNKK